MPTLRFTLRPGNVSRLHDVLSCLAKFSEVVGFDARPDRLILTALNSSKSSFASFSFHKTTFFEKYYFTIDVDNNGWSPSKAGEGRFTCQMYIKALLSVFKGRLIDARERDTSIESCQVNIQDRPDKTECRLIVKMICHHGVTKTYKLTYESVEVEHALFDPNSAKSTWAIGAIALKTFTEYFGPKTEQLDMYHEGRRMTFTSYTERIMDGKEILKQPLQTSVTIDTLDFQTFAVEEKQHIGISVKDFKAIVTHAETLKTSILALYSQPSRPMQLTYHESGVQCEFTLMTIGGFGGNSVTTVPTAIRKGSTSAAAKQESAKETTQPRVQSGSVNSFNSMPPPSRPAANSVAPEPETQRTTRPSPPPPKASIEYESLFVPAEDEEERRWGESNYEDDEDTLGWDASADNDTGVYRLPSRQETSFANTTHKLAQDVGERRIAPTQRMSQIGGMLFDD